MAKTNHHYSSTLKKFFFLFFLLALPLAVIYASNSKLNDSRSSAHSTIGDGSGGLKTISCFKDSDCKKDELCKKDGAFWYCKKKFYIEGDLNSKDEIIISWPNMGAKNYDVYYAKDCLDNGEKGFSKRGSTSKLIYNTSIVWSGGSYTFYAVGNLKNGRKIVSDTYWFDCE